MDPQLLKQTVLDQQPETLPADYIDRDISLNVLDAMNNKQVIVLTGIRRCRKSTLLQLARSKLIMPKNSILLTQL